MVKRSGQPWVAVIVGSASDADAIKPCRAALKKLGIAHEAKILSAHRTPHELTDYVATLESRGVHIVIAAAGLAAHLPGVVAAHTRLPVIGVPLAAGALNGVDALLSVAQMPGGVPVACVGVGSAGATNSAYLAARMLALFDDTVRGKLAELMEADRQKVLASALPEDVA